MRRSIQCFGGATRAQITIENGHSETWAVNCDIWFDRDIDGRWLVWAGRRDEAAVPGTDEENDDTGAIVVKDPGAIAFIEMLGELIADPARFHDEPTFPCWPGKDGA
ncbi:MAG: hypothetical protein H0T72_07520 [Chloroflexia bacterium]|jgi:hypothetical protein|nr:hypothetical protein [Chloroflexia bacterium]